MSDKIKLYRKRKDGSIGLLEVNRGGFSDADSYQEAIDHYYSVGYCDSWEEAQSSECIL